MTPIDPSRPFLLLDDARGHSRLFSDPVETVIAYHAAEVAPALERLRASRGEGLHAAGYLAYEAAPAFEPRIAERPAGPLLWFGLFDKVETAPRAQMLARLPDPAGAWAGAPRPLIERDAYRDRLAKALDWIAAGDIYQVNLTFPAEVRCEGDPLALYAGLARRAEAGWSGLVFTGSRWLLSLSPELFFTLERGRVTARPMKGTAPRGMDRDGDRKAAEALAADPKQRAENLMIVDLLRNDLSRVAARGSVETPALFTVETYPTLHHMTSTVTAKLARGRDAIDLIGAIFPCGSITGAPKIRAMEIVAELEEHPRGPYTGSIGWLAPDGDAAFNVAIRTLLIEQGQEKATLGLGSGIVADSRAGAEWRECLAKGAFVRADSPGFDLIETMRFDSHDGIVDLERHLARMKASAEALEFEFDRHDTRNELQAATFRLREDRRIRLMLSKSGAVAIEVRPLPPLPRGVVDVSLSPLPVSRSDFRLRHKTSDRAFHDRARAAAGTFETLFVDPDGFLTEGSFTSIFVDRGGKLVTPPLGRGLLPGVLRARLIEDGRAVEGELTPGDLTDGFLIGNALRGLIPARLVAAPRSSGL
jgi:para-aminobenzoate synthetase/4-amino-4-deoxychorismate lyase